MNSCECARERVDLGGLEPARAAARAWPRRAPPDRSARPARATRAAGRRAPRARAGAACRDRARRAAASAARAWIALGELDLEREERARPRPGRAPGLDARARTSSSTRASCARDPRSARPRARFQAPTAGMNASRRATRSTSAVGLVLRLRRRRTTSRAAASSSGSRARTNASSAGPSSATRAGATHQTLRSRAGSQCAASPGRAKAPQLEAVGDDRLDRTARERAGQRQVLVHGLDPRVGEAARARSARARRRDSRRHSSVTRRRASTARPPRPPAPCDRRPRARDAR